MIRYLFSRIGCLLLFFGTIVLLLGLTAAQSGETPLSLYVTGFGAFFTGLILWARMRNGRTTGKPASLFKIRSRLNEQNEDDNWEYQFYD